MQPLDPTEAFSILAPESNSRVDALRWAQQARTFLDAEVSVEGDPSTDTFHLSIASIGGSPTRVGVRTLPREACPEVFAAADRAVEAIGGAGMDVLVARAARVWQIARVVDGDVRAPLVAAALLALVLLGPIVPPDEAAIYGVRGARLRLEKRGWPQ